MILCWESKFYMRNLLSCTLLTSQMNCHSSALSQQIACIQLVMQKIYKCFYTSKVDSVHLDIFSENRMNLLGFTYLSPLHCLNCSHSLY